MKLLKKPAIALFGIVLLVAAGPNTAHAKSSVYVNVPGFSIGWHDNDRRYRKRHYRNSRGHYDRHNDNYYDRGHRSRKYRKHHNRRYDDRQYNNGYSYDNYRSGGQRYYPRDNYYNSPRVADICPVAGYNRYRDRNRSCYQHKDHYHCE